MTKGKVIMPAIKWLATLGLALLLPAAHATTAVVFSESTGRWGVTWNEPNKQEAIEVATERCRLLGGGKDCKPVKVTDERGFGAVANTCAGNYCGISVITGRRSAAQAERDAIQDCNSYYGTKNCYVLDNWEETGKAPVAKVPPPTPAPQPNSAAPTAKPAAALAQSSSSETSGKEIQDYDKACDSGDAKSCVKLGGMYEVGFRIGMDTQKAFQLYEKACDLRDVKSCVKIGDSHEQGRVSGTKDKQKAAEFYGKACGFGHALSCSTLAMNYQFGIGIHQDKQKAAQLYDQACSSGLFVSCSNLGSMYYEGDGIRQDKQKAAQFYDKACGLGDPSGCLRLGSMYAEGDGIRQDKQKALQVFDKACSFNNFIGCEKAKGLRGK